jgi:hypothetical protein
MLQGTLPHDLSLDDEQTRAPKQGPRLLLGTTTLNKGLAYSAGLNGGWAYKEGGNGIVIPGSTV